MAERNQSVYSLIVVVRGCSVNLFSRSGDSINKRNCSESVKTAVIPAVQSGLARLSHCGIASGDTQLSDSSLFVSYTCILHLLLRHIISAPFVLNLNPTALILLPKILIQVLSKLITITAEKSSLSGSQLCIQWSYGTTKARRKKRFAVILKSKQKRRYITIMIYHSITH